ncbi:N-acetylneuraminate lyase B [Ceratitis capitata]|uniref:N-acetylneuraminate lyase B n=1 Tax=Ceratitis capitata TaxID=7213 RepID=UPI000A1114F2|nr:N-acetylneuraminate lyase B [Ceratitis capitata]
MSMSFMRDQKAVNISDLSIFEGFLAPVFTCFENNEEKTLNVQHIDAYAEYLKFHGAKGVLVNSITGEGPILGKLERKLNAEAWSKACKKYKLTMLLQIGGAPLPDVLDLARHASKLNIQGVVCIPELFYKPRDVEHLVGYCKIVAKHCGQLPFLYYHLPRYTNLYFDMADFCRRAEHRIPNFLGLEYSHSDLAMAAQCMAPKRVIILSDSRLLSSGLLLGLKTFCMVVFNMAPELMKAIYESMKCDDLDKAKAEQKQLNELIRERVTKQLRGRWVKYMKNWFNEEMKSPGGADFSAGHARRLH